MATTLEQEKALREKLHTEIENRTKACSNATFECSIQRIEGYEYCIRHILQNPRVPYKQCTYTYPTNGKKCTQPAPKHDGKKDSGLTNFCFEHSRLAQVTKTRNTIGKYKHVEANEAFLNDLVHHIRVDKNKPTGSLSSELIDFEEEIDVVSPNTEPFINHVHVTDFDDLTRVQSYKRRILDYASDTSSDKDVPTMSNSWKGFECDNSDNESVDSQNEDLLKHAGIYTTEEAVNITKEKMIRLQVLYTEQILRLQHVFREKRRKYLHSIRKERESFCSINDQAKDSPKERRFYEKLKALNHYHRKFGPEAILQQKYKDKRTKVMASGALKVHPQQKCIFSQGGVRCGERSLPACKFCKKHILEDKKQVLFRACGVETSGFVCKDAVPNIFEDSTCVLHIKFPSARNYLQKKYESETEDEDEVLIKKEFHNAADIALGCEMTIGDDQILQGELSHSSAIAELKKSELIESDDIHMYPIEEVSSNVTIAHDDPHPETENQPIITSDCNSQQSSMSLAGETEVIFQVTTSVADKS